MKKIACVLMCVLMMLTIFSGCGNDYLSQYIYFQLNDAPITLDPQSASSESELLIVRNLYEGLLRKSDSGAIVCGACESFEKEGLIYTFILKEDHVWSNGAPVTADDFVFGIERALDPKTKSPFAKRLICIKGAKEFNSGEADASALSVKAVNNKTLKIELAFDDPDFKSALASSVAMPCNREFFEQSGGKYGREVDKILSNGSYYIAKWNKEDFGIRLYKNQKYNGDFEPQNAAVFISRKEKEETLKLLEKDTIDMALLDNADISGAKEKEFKVYNVDNICWVLTIGGDFNPNVKKALALSVSRDNYSKSLSDGFCAADSIYPDIIKESVSEEYNVALAYDIQTAKQILSEEISKMSDKKFPQTMLYYYNNTQIKPCVVAIAGHWQKNLGAFINIEAEDNLSYLTSQLKNSDLHLAIFPVNAKSSSGKEYLLDFGINLYGAEKSLISIEEELLKSHSVIPIAYEQTNIVTTKNIKEIFIDEENGYIDFSFVVKQD